MVSISPYSLDNQEFVEECLVKLQNFELTLTENRVEGELIASDYLEQLQTNCKDKNGQIMVSQVDGVLAGFICFWIEEEQDNLSIKDKVYGLISEIFVEEQFREHGVAHELMQKAEEYIKDRGVNKVSLQVLSKNENALKIYREIGFEDYEVILIKKL